MGSLSVFGEHLRVWRKRRGLSQLDLAMLADTTPRYVSFVETGRSRPGRGVVLRLAEAMDLPLRDRNTLLLAAGLSPVFTERALQDKMMEPVQRIIQCVFDNHEPYPACLLGSGMRFLQTNRAAERLFPGLIHMEPEALLAMWLAPGPGRENVEDWREAAHATVASLRREMLHRPSPELRKLVECAESYTADLGPAPPSSDLPVLCPTLLVQGRRIRTITTVMRFDKTTDVTTSELRIELMFPADAESEAFFRALAQTETKEVHSTPSH